MCLSHLVYEHSPAVSQTRVDKASPTWPVDSAHIQKYTHAERLSDLSAVMTLFFACVCVDPADCVVIRNTCVYEVLPYKI